MRKKWERLPESFPSREHFGLAQQMRRSAVSIASNLAEGTRLGKGRYHHHVVIAAGSQTELDTQCELASRLKLLDLEDVDSLREQLNEVGRLLHGLRRALRVCADNRSHA